MNITQTCVECIINQSKRVGDTLGLDAFTKEHIVSLTTDMSKNFSFFQTPPEVATPVYETIAKTIKTDDIYKDIKAKSTKQAISLLPLLEEKLKSSNNRFLTATKIAVAGNVIDLASEFKFDLEKELDKIFETDFAIDNTKEFYEKLLNSKKVVILGDNAGEHIFDRLYIQTLKDMFEDIEFFYFTRGKPIINDVTYDEAKKAGFDEVCEVVDSGVPTPGFVYNLANKKAKELFDSADLVISKGMGNYECLTPSHKKDIVFLLKVKCSVVAASLGLNVGDIVCKH